MGRRVKFSDRDKGWFQRRDPSDERIWETRPLRERILIVCEGEKTEPNYFESLKRELPRNLVEIRVDGTGFNTLSLVSKAQEIKDLFSKTDYPFDQVWVVFDKDSFELENFDNAIHKAEANKISCAWSNEAFELWYILHFQLLESGVSRSQYQNKLTQLLGVPYKKNSTDIYNRLKEVGNENQAIIWAKRLSQKLCTVSPSCSNPCTTVFKLVEELNRFKGSNPTVGTKDGV